MKGNGWPSGGLCLLLGIVVTACGSGAGPTEEEPPVEPPTIEAKGVVVSAATGGEVASSDGSVVVAIPAGALAADTDITVEVLDPADYPPELVGMPVLGDVYSLGPDGIEFGSPVRIIRRFPLEPNQDGTASGIPWAVQLSQDSNGEWYVLDDTEVSLDGDEFVVAASTTHFTPNVSATTVEFFRTEAHLEVVPSSVERFRGDGFTASLYIKVGSLELNTLPGYDIDEWIASNPDVLVSDGFGNQAQFLCDGTGDSEFRIDVSVAHEPGALPDQALGRLVAETPGGPITLSGQAHCFDGPTQLIQEYFQGAESRQPLRFGETDGACGFPNFQDTYLQRFTPVGDDLDLELLQPSTGQVVVTLFELATLSFQEAFNELERFENGELTLDPVTGEVILVADYYHPDPGGTCVQHWNVTGPFFPELFGPLQQPLAENGLPDFPVTTEEVEIPPNATGLTDLPMTTEEVEMTQTAEAVAAGACQSDPNTLCLVDGRFQVQAEAFTADGFFPAVEAFRIDPYTGSFSIVEAEGPEFAVKVLNGCSVNGYYWVFIGEPSADQYRLDFFETQAERYKVYLNVPGERASPITDIQAFATCQ
jgi:hypothetical protein